MTCGSFFPPSETILSSQYTLNIFLCKWVGLHCGGIYRMGGKSEDLTQDSPDTKWSSKSYINKGSPEKCTERKGCSHSIMPRKGLRVQGLGQCPDRGSPGMVHKSSAGVPPTFSWLLLLLWTSPRHLHSLPSAHPSVARWLRPTGT